MVEIDLHTALWLVNNGHAGFYSYACQAPITHSEQMAVFADDRWWRMNVSEFRVVDHGLALHPDDSKTWFRRHDIEIADNHPILALLLKDAERDDRAATEKPVVDLLARLREIEKQT